MQTHKGKSYDFEIEFFEGILKRSPDFIEALSALGDLYTKVGRYADGLEIDKRLAQMRPRDPIAMYNLACSYSLVGKVDNAFEAIQCALNFGYDDLEYLQQDDDLKNLRLDQRFREYFDPIWQKAFRNRPSQDEPKTIFKDQ